MIEIAQTEEQFLELRESYTALESSSKKIECQLAWQAMSMATSAARTSAERGVGAVSLLQIQPMMVPLLLRTTEAIEALLSTKEASKLSLIHPTGGGDQERMRVQLLGSESKADW